MGAKHTQRLSGASELRTRAAALEDATPKSHTRAGRVITYSGP